MTAPKEPEADNTLLSRRELIARMAQRADITKRAAEAYLRVLEGVLADSLASLETVRLQGVGTLRPAWRGPMVLRSPHDRRRMFVDGRWHLSFRPSSLIRERLAAQIPAHFRDERHQRAWRLAETLLADLAAYHPDREPVGVRPDDSDADVRAACERTFAAEWVRVARTWAEKTPEEVAAARDHLAAAARARWGGSS